MRLRGRQAPEQYCDRAVFNDPIVGILHGAFRELSSERPIGMAAGHIPTSTIKAYVAEEFGGLDEDGMDRMVAALRAIDAGYLKLASDKPSAATEADEKPDASKDHPVKKMLRNLAPKADRKKR